MLIMPKFISTIVAAVLTTAIATPVFAQAAIQEPGAYAFYHPNADVLAGRATCRPPAAEFTPPRASLLRTSRRNPPVHPWRDRSPPRNSVRARSSAGC